MGFRVTRIDVSGANLRNFRPDLYKYGSKQYNALIGRLKRARCRATLHVVDERGRPGTISARVRDIPLATLQHVLIPGATQHSHVRPSDLAAAEQILRHNPEMARRFRSSRVQPIDWATLPFDLNASKVMFVQIVSVGKDGSVDWGAQTIENGLFPFQDFALSPAANILHYGQGGFEGMKAFRQANGDIVIFRPYENAQRMQRGAKRLVMPPIPEDRFMEAIKAAVLAQPELIPPAGSGAALYIRPFLFGSGPVLGVKPASEYTFAVFVSPVGPYFKAGFQPTSLRVETKYHRSGPGLTGDIKADGNYVVGLMAAKEAKAAGFGEILWLDAACENVEEAGAANFFCVVDNEIYTSMLTGTILPGITRDSIIQLAREFGYTVHDDAKLPLARVLQAQEAFCTGTAAVISPIGSIEHDGTKTAFFGGSEDVPENSVTSRLYKALLAIQEGRWEDSVLRGLSSQFIDRVKREWIYVLNTAG
ncbi:MAG: branched-chain amino acid aminotransferase [Candidatus Margulisbacteria bacterium]|nr:branched-chain amino acid aminotransferase [Candidatus Margulisiibacteriota bacterium]